MSAARDPGGLATLALGGVLSRFRLQGLEPEGLARLMERYFPGMPEDGAGGLLLGPDSDPPTLSAGEFADLFSLLNEHRRDDSEETTWVARAIASACAGENHLWEDMGLPDRATLSRLIRHYFAALYHKNKANLRWKKFFYKQLCDRAMVRLCKAPHCGVCSDYPSCFGGAS